MISGADKIRKSNPKPDRLKDPLQKTQDSRRRKMPQILFRGSEEDSYQDSLNFSFKNRYEGFNPFLAENIAENALCGVRRFLESQGTLINLYPASDALRDCSDNQFEKYITQVEEYEKYIDIISISFLYYCLRAQNKVSTGESTLQSVASDSIADADPSLAKAKEALSEIIQRSFLYKQATGDVLRSQHAKEIAKQVKKLSNYTDTAEKWLFNKQLEVVDHTQRMMWQTPASSLQFGQGHLPKADPLPEIASR
jgi:hypothetical protein